MTSFDSAERERSRVWATARNILCVRLDSLGDVLMTTPAIRAVKESVPGRTVTLLTSPAGAEAARLVPEIDRVLVYDAPWMKATAPRADSRPDREMAAQLRAEGFDAGIVFTVFSQNPLPSALLLYLGDVPLRLAHCRENPYQLLTDWVQEPEPGSRFRHEVRRQLDLVATAGCQAGDERLSIRASSAAYGRVQSLLNQAGVDRTRPWAVVHPGASAASRRYPPESFAQAAALLAREGWGMVFSGSAQERALVEGIRRAMDAPSLSLAGRLSLEELVALIDAAPLLIANNTGPVHIAAATGTPVVDLYALTNPQHTPWSVPQRVLSADVPCRNCFKSVCPEGHHRCLRDVPPEAVARAAVELYHEVHAGRPLLEVLV